MSDAVLGCGATPIGAQPTTKKPFSAARFTRSQIDIGGSRLQLQRFACYHWTVIF
jgi:hypothetical protein